MKPRVKIWCIRSGAEAALAIRHGAAALGVVSAMTGGRGVMATRIATCGSFRLRVLRESPHPES